MAQCQNFFDDRSPRVCRQSGSDEQQQLSPPASTVAEGSDAGSDDHCLDLRLGLSVEVSKPKQHEMVRPIPLYPSLDKQRSGSYATATGNSPLFRGRSEEKALFSKDSAFSTPPLISREQVWQSLQSSTSAVLDRDSGPSKAFCEDVSSSLLYRRSTSMQIMMPKNEMSEVNAYPIRRSCSNGIPQRLLSLQPSGEEALIDESPDPANSAVHQHHQDALELQKKKEMQAHRRLEARKRRRLLIEKQQRRARQNTGLHNRQLISPGERVSLVGRGSMDYGHGPEPKPAHELRTVKPVDDHIKGRDQGKYIDNPLPRDSMSAEVHEIKNFCSIQSSKVRNSKMLIHMEYEITSSDSRHAQGELASQQHMDTSHDSAVCNGQKVAVMCTEAVKIRHSSCSETESTESKEKDSLELESSSRKSSAENHLDDLSVSASTSPSSEWLRYPQASPDVLPDNMMKAQMHPSLPSTLQFPSATVGRNDGFHTWPLASPSCRVSKLSTEVPSNFTIRRSVGVFAEGKWSIPSQEPAFVPLRRTASNINEAMAESHCPANKKLETYVSLSASQMKFAAMVSNDMPTARFMSRRESQSSNKQELHDKALKTELDLLSAPEEKPAVASTKAQDRTGELQTSYMVATPVKVKQEEAVMEDRCSDSHFIKQHLPPVVPHTLVGGQTERHLSPSFSELPWVTTTGRGPNGRTINGVMYIAGGHSVRLVCRCHGKHMSPVEFLEHAGSNDLSNPLRNIVVNPFPLFNRLASTPV